MFQYTNTIVLNKLTDDTTGLPKLVEITNPTELIDNSGAVIAAGATTGLEVRRVNNFFKPYVVRMTKRAASDPVLGNATLTIATAAAGIYRLSLYIRLTDNQNSYYANDMVFKGRPFEYEFSVSATDTATTMAAACVKAVNKTQSLFGDKFFTVTSNAGVVTVNCLDEHQIIKQAVIQKLSDATNDNPVDSTFQDYVTGVITQSVPGFGTYNQVIKDLRLPTMENLRFAAINSEERPIIGAKYDQFIITYRKPRGTMGAGVMGAQVTSETNHVFFVLSTLSDAFATKLNKQLGDILVINKPGSANAKWTAPVGG